MAGRGEERQEGPAGARLQTRIAVRRSDLVANRGVGGARCLRSGRDRAPGRAGGGDRSLGSRWNACALASRAEPLTPTAVAFCPSLGPDLNNCHLFFAITKPD